MDHSNDSMDTSDCVDTSALNTCLNKLNEAFRDIRSNRSETSKIEISQASQPRNVQIVYEVLQKLPHNMFFTTKNISTSDHPSLYPAVLEHMKISKKELRKFLNIMRLSSRSFPLLKFTKPMVGLIMIKENVDDVVIPPVSVSCKMSPPIIASLPQAVTKTATTASDIISKDQQEHPMYKMMKYLPRNTFYAIGTLIEPSLFTAVCVARDNLEAIYGREQELEEMNEIMFKERGKKIKFLEVIMFTQMARNSPQLFPLIHFYPVRQFGFKWIMIKSDVSIRVIGGPEDEQSGKGIIDHIEQGFLHLMSNYNDIYNEIILRLDPLKFYFLPSAIRKLINASTNIDAKPIEDIYLSCKKIKVDLSRGDFINFFKFYIKYSHMFPRLQRAKWKECGNEFSCFIVKCEDQNTSTKIIGQSSETMDDSSCSDASSVHSEASEGIHNEGQLEEKSYPKQEVLCKRKNNLLKKQEKMQKEIDKITSKLAALSNEDKPNMQMLI